MMCESSAALGRQLLGWANHDICPGLNRYLTWLRHPLTWLVVGALSAGAIGAFVAPHARILSGGTALVAVVGVVWPKLAVLGLRGTLTFARDRCHEQDTLVVRLSIENRWPWPVWGLAVARNWVADASADDERELFGLAKLPGWSRGEFEFVLTPERRGQFPKETPCLATGFPFGIWSARRELSVPMRLIVWPQVARLRAAPAGAGTSWATTAALQDRAGEDGETVSCRPYQQGDSLRKIHWAHTARREALFVRERQSPVRRQALVVLRTREWTDSSHTSLDDAVRMVASILTVLHDRDWSLQCRLNDELFRVGAGSRGLRPILDRLASLTAEDRGSDASSSGEGHGASSLVIRVRPATPCETARSSGPRVANARRGDREIVLEAGSLKTHSLGGSTDWRGRLVQQWERACHDAA